MLKMHINPKADFLSAREVTVEPPYQMVGSFLMSDAGSLKSVNLLLDEMGKFANGAKPFPLTGNAYSLDFEGETTRLAQVVGVEKEIEIPTKWIVAALEQWRDYLTSRRR